MRGRPLIVASLLWLLAHTGAAAQGRGAGVLTVTVVDDRDRPIARAHVMLSVRGEPAGATDEQGRVEFTGLGQDPFIVRAGKDGYVSAAYGERLSNIPSIELWPSERLAIRVRLDREASLAGAVSTDGGEAASEAMVTARRWQSEDGRRILEDCETIGTDQYGRFRFYGLDPGLYVVTAEVASPWRGEGVQRAGSRDVATVRTDLFGSIPAAITSSAPDGLRLAPGQELGGVHIVLAVRTVRTATVEGTLVVPFKVEDQSDPELRRLDDSPASSRYDRHSIDASVDDDGHFVFRGVTPGRYRITAHWSRPDDERWATQDIDVAGEPVTGITLVPRRGSVVSGRLVVLDAEGTPFDPSKLEPHLIDAGDDDKSPGDYGFSADRDGRFRFASVPPGRYRFDDTLYGRGTTNLRVSAFVNGVDAVDVPFDIAPGRDVTDIVMTLTVKRATISGLVIGPDDKPAPDALVIAFSTDRRYWLPDSTRVSLDVPDSRGRYALTDLPPGEYWVGIYLHAPAEGDWDTALLEAMVPCAIKVTLARGEERALTLRVVGK